MKAETEFILQCNRNSFIEQVMYSRETLDARSLINQPLLFCLSPDYLEAGKQFIDEIRLAGKAENRVLEIVLQDKSHIFTFSGVQLRDHIIIVAQQTHSDGDIPSRVNEILAEEMADALAESSTEAEAGKAAEVTVWDLMEEMSRLNNELINTKRELIRKNMELERLQKQLKKG